MKPFSSFDQQVEIILQRGVKSRTLDEKGLRDEIKRRLQYVNYYRLSAYWYRFLDTGHAINGHQRFQEGTYWEDIWARYVTDRRLRILLLDAISRFEVALRTQVAYNWIAFFNQYTKPQSDPAKYMKSMNAFSSKERGKVQAERKELEDMIQKNFERNRTSFVDFDATVGKVKYAVDLATWSYIEFATLGNICVLLKICLPQRVVKNIAKKLGFNSANFFCSAVAFLKDVRNACAHQARILDRRWITKKKNLILRKNDTGTISSIASTDRTAVALCLCAFILDVIAPKSTWKARCKKLILTAQKETPHLCEDLGFKSNWFEYSMWQ